MTARTTQQFAEVLRSNSNATDPNTGRTTQIFAEVLRSLTDQVPVQRRIVVISGV